MRLHFGLATLVVLVSFHEASCEERQRSISVDARSEVRVAPDEAVLEFDVDTLNREAVTVAKTENDRISVRVTRALKKLALEPEALRVTGLDIGKRYDNGVRRFLGYGVTRSFEIRTGKFEEVEKAIAVLVELAEDAIEVSDLSYRVKDQRKHQTEARRLAMQYAREKAAHLAELNGLTLGLASEIRTNVEETDSSGGFYGFGGGGFSQTDLRPETWKLASQQQFVATPASKEAPKVTEAERQLLLSPGQVSLNCTVYVTFDLVPE